MQIESLNKSYGSTQVLKEINLHFPKGQTTGIVGENGAGKTTLFRCIVGLESYDGHIFYENKIIKNVVAYLPTTPYMLPFITGYEYIKLVCLAKHQELKDIKERNIFELPLQAYADQYSTGMKKKLALTALLLCEHDIYILDEPFNGVDIQSNIMIKLILKELKARGKTIILSSHLFSSLEETCDQLHLLEDGRIKQSVQKGAFKSIEDMLMAKAKKGILQKLWDK